MGSTTLTAASGTWTPDAGITNLYISCYGGGGAGGGNTGTSNGGGGGGGGAHSRHLIASPSGSYDYVCGAAGTGVANGNGGNGGDTWFGSVTTCLAKAGSGGQSNANGRAGGAGGSKVAGFGNQALLDGGWGEYGRAHSTGRGGYGGSSGGSSLDGYADGSSPTWNSVTAPQPPAGGYIGGDGATTGNGISAPGYAGGGGGASEGTNTTGGNGGAGVILLSWTDAPQTQQLTNTDVPHTTFTLPSHSLAPGAVALSGTVPYFSWNFPAHTIEYQEPESQPLDGPTPTFGWGFPEHSLVPGAVALSGTVPYFTWNFPSHELVPGAVALSGTVPTFGWNFPSHALTPGTVALTGDVPYFTWEFPAHTLNATTALSGDVPSFSWAFPAHELTPGAAPLSGTVPYYTWGFPSHTLDGGTEEPEEPTAPAGPVQIIRRRRAQSQRSYAAPGMLDRGHPLVRDMFFACVGPPGRLVNAFSQVRGTTLSSWQQSYAAVDGYATGPAAGAVGWLFSNIAQILGPLSFFVDAHQDDISGSSGWQQVFKLPADENGGGNHAGVYVAYGHSIYIDRVYSSGNPKRCYIQNLDTVGQFDLRIAFSDTGIGSDVPIATSHRWPITDPNTRPTETPYDNGTGSFYATVGADRMNTNNYSYWHGAIRAVYVWSRMLTKAEHLELMENPFAPFAPRPTQIVVPNAYQPELQCGYRSSAISTSRTRRPDHMPVSDIDWASPLARQLTGLWVDFGAGPVELYPQRGLKPTLLDNSIKPPKAAPFGLGYYYEDIGNYSTGLQVFKFPYRSAFNLQQNKSAACGFTPYNVPELWTSIASNHLAPGETTNDLRQSGSIGFVYYNNEHYWHVGSYWGGVRTYNDLDLYNPTSTIPLGTSVHSVACLGYGVAGVPDDAYAMGYCYRDGNIAGISQYVADWGADETVNQTYAGVYFANSTLTDYYAVSSHVCHYFALWSRRLHWTEARDFSIDPTILLRPVNPTRRIHIVPASYPVGMARGLAQGWGE